MNDFCDAPIDAFSSFNFYVLFLHPTFNHSLVTNNIQHVLLNVLG